MIPQIPNSDFFELTLTIAQSDKVSRSLWAEWSQKLSETNIEDLLKTHILRGDISDEGQNKGIRKGRTSVPIHPLGLMLTTWPFDFLAKGLPLVFEKYRQELGNHPILDTGMEWILQHCPENTIRSSQDLNLFLPHQKAWEALDAWQIKTEVRSELRSHAGIWDFILPRLCNQDYDPNENYFTGEEKTHNSQDFFTPSMKKVTQFLLDNDFSLKGVHRNYLNILSINTNWEANNMEIPAELVFLAELVKNTAHADIFIKEMTHPTLLQIIGANEIMKSKYETWIEALRLAHLIPNSSLIKNQPRL